LTGSRILVVFAHAYQKIGQIYLKLWSNLLYFPPYNKSGTEKSNLGSKFTPEVVLKPLLLMRTKSGQNGSKRGQIGKNSGSVWNLARNT